MSRKNLLDAVGSGITYGVGSASGSSDYADSTAKSVTGALLGEAFSRGGNASKGATPFVKRLKSESIGQIFDKMTNRDKNK